jgi:HlyD family secretion protein
MRNKIIFILAAIGLVLAAVSAYLSAQQPSAQPPVFSPAANPFPAGIYANGIIESDQANGENINLYPEVSGPITQVLVAEGQSVHKGDVLLTIDDSVQRATAEQQHSQAEAALTMLKELRSEPRPETLAVAAAQVESARASLKGATDERAKQERSYAMEPKSVSLDTLDNARNAMRIAEANLGVAEKQYALTRAGAWKFDIENQEKQSIALSKAYAASAALLAKYTIRAPADGVVLAIHGALGSYVSPQGVYDSYTEDPLIVMGMPQDHLAVRVYIDEILVHRLPEPARMTAKMFIRGTNVSLPLSFAHLQPYVTPKIELSDQRLERVDLRVLPIVFRFEKPAGLRLYPGQLVDVYVGETPK